MDCGGRRRRHPRATIWIAIRPEQGHPSSLPLMVLIAFLRCVGKTCRTMAPWPDSGGTGETGGRGRRETGSRERTAAIR